MKRKARADCLDTTTPNVINDDDDAIGLQPATKKLKRDRYRNGGPLSSGANLEPVAKRKRKWTQIPAAVVNHTKIDLAGIDMTDANGDIIMADCISIKIEV